MSSTRRLSIIVGLYLGLTSCHSFNRYTIITTTENAEPHRTTAALAQAALSDEAIKPEGNDQTPPDSSPPKKGIVAVCPLYKLPDLPASPELPYDKLAKLSDSNDPHAFDQVAEDQIKTLYMYIGSLKKTLRESHQQYLKDCQEYLKTGHQNSLGQ